MVQGRRVTDAEVHRRDGHGAERAHQHAHPRHLPRAQHRCGRHQRRGCGPRARAQASAGEARRRQRARWTTASSATSIGVDTTVIRKLLDNGLMPVVSPLSADETGMLLNINADTVAAAIGAALGAEKLILCTGAPGILERVEDPGSLISYTDLRGLKRLKDEKRIVDGMLPKAKAIEDAIRGGVRRVHVVSYKLARGHPRRSVHERRHGHADRGGHQRAFRRTSSRPGAARAHDAALGQGRSARRACARSTRRARTMRSMSGWCATTCAPPSRMRRCCMPQKLLSDADLRAIRAGPRGARRMSTRMGTGTSS